MKITQKPFWSVCAICFFTVFVLWRPSATEPPPYDLATEKVNYQVSTSHMDDVWQWTIDSTINVFLPRTTRANFALFKQFPEYIFNWEGAYRYWLIKQHYPNDYKTLKQYIASGNWRVCGSMVTPADAQIPAPESLIRQILYGNGFFMDEFGKKSIDIFMPDCFGFTYALPTIGVHCGLKGFSTCRIDWHPFWTWPYPPPWPIGRWRGPDGSELIATGKVGPWYVNNKISVDQDDGDWQKQSTGIWTTFSYIGVGDRGGALPATDVARLLQRQKESVTEDIRIINAGADQLFRDLTDKQIAAMDVYEGEFANILETGCNTTHADVKLAHRLCEQRAAAAEHAAVVANHVTGTTYPAQELWFAWWRFLEHEFHDDLPGTSLQEVYDDYTLPRLDSSLNEYTKIMDNSSAAIAAHLDTRVMEPDRIPLVLYNQLSFERHDVVEADVNVGSTAPVGIKVYGPDGLEVPAQITGMKGSIVSIVFTATLPPAGYAVYEVKPVAAANPSVPALAITATQLENDYYRVSVNANGDISAIFDKTLKRELLSAPSRYEGTGYVPETDNHIQARSYVVNYATIQKNPDWYVDQSVQKTIAENGPARISLKVSRTRNKSTFTNYIRLAAGKAGARIEVDNVIDWNTPGYLLAVSFPMTASNPMATYDLGLGTIRRPNSSNPLYYEFTAQHWADITNQDNAYGLSVLTDCKYGWHKKANNLLALSLIHSATDTRYNGDIFEHRFNYSLYGHTGDWTNGTVEQGAALNQPVFVYQATPHKGVLGRSYSFLRVSSPQVQVMALKKAEKGDTYVVRVRETQGKSIQGARITFGSTVLSASELLGSEEPRAGGAIQISGKELVFDMTKYQPKTFSFTLEPLASGTRPPVSRWTENWREVRIMSPVLLSRVSIRVPANETVSRIAIFDALGRNVQTLYSSSDGALLGDQAEIRWNGRDSRGNNLHNGVYFICLETERNTFSKRVTVY